MPGKSTWEAFFDAHAPVYDDNVFTKNTFRRWISCLKSCHCDRVARFSMSDAAQGVTPLNWRNGATLVTGLDLSSEMLARAAAAAKTAECPCGMDSFEMPPKFSFPGRFDAAICLCEGAFGLLGQGDDSD